MKGKPLWGGSPGREHDTDRDRHRSRAQPPSARGSTERLITSRRIAMSMMITISGTANTPLITAGQNSALIGSKPTKLMSMPISVDTAMVP
jgi:hypothetical protein